MFAAVKAQQNCSQTNGNSWYSSPGLEILHVNWRKISLSPCGLSHTSTHTPPLLSSMSPQIRSSITLAPKTRSPCVHITPQNVDHNREADESTHTLFGLRTLPPPLELPVTPMAERCRHIPGTLDCAQQWAGSGGSLTCLLASPPWREVSGRGGVFSTVVRIAYCTHTSSFRAHSQICGRGVTAPPSFCQVVSKQQGRRWTSAQRKRNVTGGSASNKTLNLWTYSPLWKNTFIIRQEWGHSFSLQHPLQQIGRAAYR